MRQSCIARRASELFGDSRVVSKGGSAGIRVQCARHANVQGQSSKPIETMALAFSILSFSANTLVTSACIPCSVNPEKI